MATITLYKLSPVSELTLRIVSQILQCEANYFATVHSATCFGEEVSDEEMRGEAGADDDVALVADQGVQGRREGLGVLVPHPVHEPQVVQFLQVPRLDFLYAPEDGRGLLCHVMEHIGREINFRSVPADIMG